MSRLRNPGEAPVVGVIYNPRSHRNIRGNFDFSLYPNVLTAQPDTLAQLTTAMSEFAEKGIHLLVICGGDGTIRDVLTCGLEIFGDYWPAIAVLPRGKTNALSVDLAIPRNWGLQDALAALDHGKRVYRCPMKVTSVSEQRKQVAGFILGAGAFTKATRAGQRAHKLGAFGSTVVGVTGMWALMQFMFAARGNAWRQGARMRIGLGNTDEPMGHSGKGDPSMRQLLFASTLERFPAGMRPFGALKTGLKLVVVDQISRRAAMMIPIVLMSKLKFRLRQRGIHQLLTTQFSLSIDDEVILDGEAFPSDDYRIEEGPELAFIVP
jgi:hypothetical protein